MDNDYIKEEKKNNLVPSLMGFEKQFNLDLVSRTHKLVNQDLLARNVIYSWPHIATVKDWQKNNLPKIDRLDLWLVIILSLYSHNSQLYSHNSHKQVSQYKDHSNNSNNLCHQKLDYISNTRRILQEVPLKYTHIIDINLGFF